MMFRKTWPLIAYTVFVQFSVGLCLFSAANQWLSIDGAASGSNRMALLVAVLLLAVGLLLSFFHLGSPFRAYRALSNIKSSWLSREILVSVILFVLLFACYAADGDGQTHPLLLATATLVGLITILVMASAYYKTGRIGWATLRTYVLFLISTVVLGAAGTAVAAASLDPNAAGAPFKSALILALLALVVEMLVVRVSWQKNKTREATSDMDRTASAAALEAARIEEAGKKMMAGTAVSMAGIALISLIIAARPVNTTILIVLLLILLAGETISRYGFMAVGYPGDIEEA